MLCPKNLGQKQVFFQSYDTDEDEYHQLRAKTSLNKLKSAFHTDLRPTILFPRSYRLFKSQRPQTKKLSISSKELFDQPILTKNLMNHMKLNVLMPTMPMMKTMSRKHWTKQSCHICKLNWLFQTHLTVIAILFLDSGSASTSLSKNWPTKLIYGYHIEKI